MSVKSIILKAEESRALQADGKVTISRIVKRLKLHSDYGEPDWTQAWVDNSYDPPCLKVEYSGCWGGMPDPTIHRHWSPYAPGDRLWVRETFWKSTCKRYVALPAGKRNCYPIPPDIICSKDQTATSVPYAGRKIRSADGNIIGGGIVHRGEKELLNCVAMFDAKRKDLYFYRRPSSQMPRWASRFGVEVKSATPKQGENWKWLIELKMLKSKKSKGK